MPDWKRFLAIVKEECLAARWSKGAELARDGVVAGQEQARGAWTFRVRAVGRAVAPTVSLYPDDGEWDCDCNGPCDPCEHVAACTIAIAATPEAPETLFAASIRSAGIRYDLHGDDTALNVDRYVVEANGEPRKLRGSLSALTSGAGGLTFAPTHADLAVDRILSISPATSQTFDRAVTLLRALINVDDLRIDGMPVRASAEPVFPRARVVDAPGNGVELVIEADPEVERVVAPGVLLRRGTLHPFGARDRFGQRWERLPFRRAFSGLQIAELVGTVIPELERHIAVEIRTSRLPKREGHVAPWIRFEIDFVDQGIDVLPLLVYGDPPLARVDGERFVHLTGAVPQRRPKLEKELLLRLHDALNLAPGRRVHFVANDAARFLADLESFDDGRRDRDRARSDARARRVALVPRIIRDGDDIDVVFEATEREPGAPHVRASAAAVVGAWRDGIGLVPLDDGRFGAVPADWLATHGTLVADLLAAREQNAGKTPTAALPLVGDLYDALETPVPFEVTRLRALLEQPQSVEGIPPATVIPPGFHGELRHYQLEGVAWLSRLRGAGLGAVLADDMGLGKTVQALCVVGGRTLVVCPRSVIHNWTKEIERFRPDLTFSLYHGPARALTDAAVTLTTYATLRNDADVLAGVEWDCVVLDEAQAIKNPDSQVARAAYGLNAAFRLSLSGTPIENRLDELWSQMHFVNRGLLGGRRDFASRYERPMLAADASAAERLRTRIRPFILRRLKKEVATELPPRTDAILYCELDADERALYDAVRAAARADVVKQLSAGSGVMAAFEALLRLRQAACHSGLLPGREAQTSSKVEALMDALDDVVADHHKALVFSQWTSLLDRIEPHLQARNTQFLRLDGSTRDRGGVVEGFQREDGPPILLISLRAGGTGLNLTAADHVFLLDPWWNPAVEEQAADRTHRIGQERPVMVYRMVAKDTVEERVLDLQRRKREIADAALSGGEHGVSTNVTREEILALLD